MAAKNGSIQPRPEAGTGKPATVGARIDDTYGDEGFLEVLLQMLAALAAGGPSENEQLDRVRRGIDEVEVLLRLALGR